MSVRVTGGALALAVASLLAACGGDSSSSSSEAAPSASLRVVSSEPQWVSGGDARVAVRGDADLLAGARLRLNGEDLDTEGFQASGEGVEGMVRGLEQGDNELTVWHPDHGTLARLTLTNYPVEGPMFSGPHQYPFVCTTVSELGKQPLVDTDGNEGFPVYDDQNQQIGLSRDCGIEPYTEYWYRTTGGQYQRLPDGGSRPADMATTILSDGREVDFVVRWERGTINRFIYSIAMLAEAGEEAGSLDTGLWNGRLMFRFQGGVGIGHTQGSMDYKRRALQPDVLGQGYAIIYSTGTRMSEHYNMQVGGETALMVKERFLEEYGEPLYTVGLGASGGAIQQYVYAQNHPGLIDAAIPVQSYPDMVTQTIHIGDCELLEYYMDATDKDNPKWATTKNRTWLVGLNAEDDVEDPLYAAKQQLGYGGAPGSTECVESWRGLTPLTMNPYYGQADNQDQMQPPGLMATVNWSHYDDLRNIYGVDGDGYPHTLFDNVGVQYGLESLNAHRITPEEFLDLNARVGGWKDQKDMVQEGFPFLGSEQDVMNDPSIFDPWSSRNMTLGSDPSSPAPRTEGDLEAMNGAYQSGMVFHGEAEGIPIIDYRPYLEHELDMHNVHQSFVVRQRMRDHDGDADNQVIWFTDARPEENYSAVPLALEVIDDWMANLRANPEAGVAGNKPELAVDTCFDTDGNLIARGDDVWNGILDEQDDGACTAHFPVHSTSRIVAGAPIQGDVFKCALKPVSVALEDGTYGTWQPTSDQVNRLNAIFPDGVCDYSQPDQGRPEGL
ncbi:DUF6351 family protein [Alloalcanivorax marinus]|uniref:DUF6351 family protein n=1 Tax=Alloalcanivorax marinus TaxID=1177169 RepID=UPI0019329CFD|nr:DUF6351 family protein [Alloalcanivorax marinus]MBL7250639.1 hypothetical protein [Alloalcanivorax marinus]